MFDDNIWLRLLVSPMTCDVRREHDIHKSLICYDLIIYLDRDRGLTAADLFHRG